MTHLPLSSLSILSPNSFLASQYPTSCPVSALSYILRTFIAMWLISLALVPLLAVPIHAKLATDLFSYANSLVSSDPQVGLQESKDGDVRVFDAWNYVDCGTAADIV